MYVTAVIKVLTRRMNCGYIIVEFHDGLQLIPAVWYNADMQCCIWPSHYKTKLRINTAIIRQEIPKNESDWEDLPVKRIFGVAATYEKGLEKLVAAQDTSNIENNETSSAELRERKKQKRRINAKRHFSSSSDEENKENGQTQKKKQLPSLPRLQDFTSSTSIINKIVENVENTSHEETSVNKTNSINSNDVYKQYVPSGSGYSAEKTVIEADEENYISHECKKQILLKLNKVLYKLDVIQNKINLVEEKISHPININEELDIQLPISSQEELQLFEEQLAEESFKNQVFNILKLVGGSNPHVMIRNMLKKVITNTLAQHFSWAGKKAKRNFKDLKLANVIIQAVRAVHSRQVTDVEIVNSISKWLAQATLRCHREKPTEPKQTDFMLRNMHTIA